MHFSGVADLLTCLALSADRMQVLAGDAAPRQVRLRAAWVLSDCLHPSTALAAQAVAAQAVADGLSRNYLLLYRSSLVWLRPPGDPGQRSAGVMTARLG